LNGHGEVIGINTAKIVGNNSQSLGFALSSTDLLAVLGKFYPDSSSQSQAPPAIQEVFGSLSISSTPDGADVYVDGKFVGNTPETLKLPTGTHVIRITSEGKKDWQRSIEVLKDNQLNLRAEFNP
jgi:serine protease Do